MNNPIGICEWCVPADGLAASLDWAARAGLQGLAPDLGTPGRPHGLDQEAARHQCREAGERLGLSLPALSVNLFCEVGMSDPAAEPEVQAAFAAAVDTAAALGIPIIQVPSFFAGSIDSKEDLDQTVRVLRQACVRAEGTPVLIGSENVLPADQQRELVTRVDHPQFRVVFDTRNPFAMKRQNGPEVLRAILPHVAQVHVKDGLDDGPSTVLGQGNSDYHDSIRILADADYPGWLILENDYRCLDGPDSFTRIRQDIDTIRRG